MVLLDCWYVLINNYDFWMFPTLTLLAGMAGDNNILATMYKLTEWWTVVLCEPRNNRVSIFVCTGDKMGIKISIRSKLILTANGQKKQCIFFCSPSRYSKKNNPVMTNSMIPSVTNASWPLTAAKLTNAMKAKTCWNKNRAGICHQTGAVTDMGEFSTAPRHHRGVSIRVLN